MISTVAAVQTYRWKRTVLCTEFKAIKVYPLTKCNAGKNDESYQKFISHGFGFLFYKKILKEN